MPNKDEFEVTFVGGGADDSRSSREEVLLKAKTFHYDNNNKQVESVETTETFQQVQEPTSAQKQPTEPLVETISMNNECHDDQVISCAICHMEMEDGDRVGDLPCNHVMHIECLKAWIVRRNVCPLCLQSNIATPRRTSENQTHYRPELVVTGE